MIYFDNSATTKIDPTVLKTYQLTAEKVFGNPSSLHDLGTSSYRLLSESRKQIASLLNVLPEEIFFTSGGTEGDNWVLKGTAIEKRKFGKHILVSSVEHPAVMESAKQLEELGFEVEYIPVDARGFVKLDELKKMLRSDTILVSVMAVNNEIGSIQPIVEIAKILQDYPTLHFHVDAVQALSKVPIEKWLPERVDFATFSGHKFHGPRGVGFIYWKKGRKLAPLLSGGGQEDNHRSGTENLPAIVAMAKALRLVLTDESQKQKFIKKNRDYLLSSLKQYPELSFYTESGDDFAPNILSFGIKDIRGEVLVHALEEKQIFISTTSACSSKKKMAGSTIHAMGVPDWQAKSAVRISLDESNTAAEMEQFLTQFKFLREKFKKINGIGG